MRIVLFSLLMLPHVLDAAPMQNTASRRVFVRDLWSGRALSGVMVIINGDTLYTDASGSFQWLSASRKDQRSIQLHKDGYFEETMSVQRLNRRAIYLVPIEAIEAIPAIVPRASDRSPTLPTHVERLDLQQARNAGYQSLADVLQNQAGMMVKTYGAGGQLQTIALRGMAAEQTRVLFDGVPVNNLQTGSSSIAQFNNGFLNRIDIYRGGHSPFGSSGAIGGTVNLKPEPLHDKLFYRVRARYNALDNRVLSFQSDVPFLSANHRIYISQNSGHNDYSTSYGDKTVALSNRDFDQRRLVYQNKFFLNKRWTLSLYGSQWLNEAGATKPFTSPASEEANKARIQQDHNLVKMKLGYRRLKKSFISQAYVRNEWMAYMDPVLLEANEPLHSLHFNQARGLQFRFRMQTGGGWLWQLGGAWTQHRMKSSDAGVHRRNKQTASANVSRGLIENRLGFNTAQLDGSLRIVSIPEQGITVLPAVGLSAGTDHWHWFASVGRNYRAPTFNDLYWQPGGNPQLKAEESLNWEAGAEASYILIRNIVAFTGALNLYQNHVSDQIKWLPDGAYWRPFNIIHVRSRGLELEADLHSLDRRQQLLFHYTYGTSENRTPSGDHYGNQLPFLPRESWFAQIRSGWERLSTGASLSGMSFRYTTLDSDADLILPAHTVSRVWFGLEHTVSGHRLRWHLSLNNALNENYEVMPGYPMPGRHFSLGFTMENIMKHQ